MILIDTNILVYALGKPHPLREPAQKLLDVASRGGVEARTIDVVIVELLHVFSRRRPRSATGAAARDCIELLAPLVDVTSADVALGVEIFERHEALESADALIAAVALNHEADALVTADGSFAAVAGLRVVDPRSHELETLLAR